MADELRENDPNREVLNSPKSDMTPGFLGGTGGGDAPSGLSGGSSSKAKKASDAKNLLNGSEAGAAEQGGDEDGGGFYNGDGGVLGARKNEESGGGLYRAVALKGRGKKKGKKGQKKGFKGLLSRGKPAILTGLILSVFGVGAISFTGISTEIISWKENVSSMFGQNSAVINRRSNFMMRKLLSPNKSTTNATGTKYKISKKLANKLSEQGIDYIETTDANGKKLKMLVFEDSDGNSVPVVASEGDVSRANSLAGTEIDVDGKKVTLSDSSMTLADAKSSSEVFETKYGAATETFTGKIAGWFDNMTDSLLKRIVGDNARNQTAIDNPDEESVDDLMLKNVSEGIEDTEMKATYEEKTEDGGTNVRPAEASDTFDDGEGHTMTYGEVEGQSGKVSTDSPEPESVGASLKAKAQKVAMLASTVACGFLKGVGAISTAIGAVQTMNVISYASKYLEIADKIKYGDADEVTNIALNNLNTPVDTVAYDIDGNEVPLSGATNASDGFNAVFASENILSENDPSVLMSNRELATKNAMRTVAGNTGVLAEIMSSVASFGAGITAFRICNTVQAVAGAISGIADIAAFFTMGATAAIKEIAMGAVKGLALAGEMMLISAVISAITPTVAHWFADKLTNTFLGENGGVAMLSGAQNILGSNLQMSTGKYASKENAIEMFGLTKSVEREWAEYERATRSPFDLTSEYTFLGSLYNSIHPIVSQSSGGAVLSTVSSVANLTKSSAIALVSPSASAADEVDNLAQSISSEENCGYLSSVGVAGDYMCNKYSGAYVNELTSLDPEDNEEIMREEYDSFAGEDSDGNPKVKEGSDYAKFIVACVANDAQPGTMSAAVEGYIEQATNPTDSTVANGLINMGKDFIPFTGFLDVADAGEQEANFPWNSGQACTGNTDNAGLNEEVMHFSAYNLDQRVLYDMGVTETNSTVAFLEDYYEKNPLDNSFEGKIARFSGMSKEEVSDTLAVIDYFQYISEYDPSERYAFGSPAVEMDNVLLFDNNNAVAADATLLNVITYADVRNRSFAV